MACEIATASLPLRAPDINRVVAFTFDPAWSPRAVKAIKQALRAPELVTKLQLSDIWGDALPDFFDTFPNLEDLSISGTSARTLPPTLGSCRSLKWVWIGECRELQNIDLLWELPQLEAVFALHCQSIGSIAPTIASAQALTTLQLSLTSLVTLPSAVTELPKLTSISLGIHYGLDMRALWPVLAACPALETLALRGCRMLTWPEPIARPPRLKLLHVGMWNSSAAELPSGMVERLREALEGVTVLDGAEPLLPPKRASAAAKTKPPKPKREAKSSSAATKAKPAKIAGIPITREELEPLFGGDEPLFAYSYACTFRSALDLPQMKDAITPQLSQLRAAKEVTLGELPAPDGPELAVLFSGRQVAVTIKRSTDDPTRWVLAALYSGQGKPWGSNHALFLWLVQTILPWIAAQDARIEPNPNASKRR